MLSNALRHHLQTRPRDKDWKGLGREFRAFLRQDDAVSAIEFAFVLPVLIVLYLAGAEGFLLIRAHQQLSAASATLASIMARGDEARNNDFRNAFYAAKLRMIHLDPGLAVYTVRSLENDGSTATADIVWETADDGTGTLLDTDANIGVSISIPNNLIETNGTILQATVSQTYTNPIGFFFADVGISKTSYHRIRNRDELPRVYADCTQTDRTGIRQPLSGYTPGSTFGCD